MTTYFLNQSYVIVYRKVSFIFAYLEHRFLEKVVRFKFYNVDRMSSNIVETQQTRFFHDKVIHALTSQTLENRVKTSKIFKKIINFRH